MIHKKNTMICAIIFIVLLSFTLNTNAFAEDPADQSPDSSTVDKSDSSTVDKPDSNTVDKSDSNTVDKSDSKTVDKSDSSTVDKSDSNTVDKSDSSTVDKSDSSTVDKSDSNTVDKSDSNTVDKSDSNTVDKSDSSTVDKPDSSTVDKSDSSTVDKSDSNTVDKSASNTVDKSDSSTVDKQSDNIAGKSAVTNLMPRTSKVIGSFNIAIYQMFIHPFGTAYGKVVPNIVDKKINDVLDWSYGPYYMVNDILMWDLKKLANNTGAFLINGTVGILGVFDVSSSLDIHQSKDNLLGTLHTWGLKDHIYIQLPFVGPQTDLTMISLLTSSFLKPTTWLAPSSTLTPGKTFVDNALYTRNILEYGEITVEVSQGLNVLRSIPGDKGVLMRDAWLSLHNLYLKGESAYDLDLDDDDGGDDDGYNDEFGDSDF